MVVCMGFPFATTGWRSKAPVLSTPRGGGGLFRKDDLVSLEDQVGRLTRWEPSREAIPMSPPPSRRVFWHVRMAQLAFENTSPRWLVLRRRRSWRGRGRKPAKTLRYGKVPDSMA